MTDQTTESTAVEGDGNGNDVAKARRVKPQKPLPTDRITFSKQVDILRAYGSASGSARKALKLSDVAALVKMHPNTVTLVNPFFNAVGLIQKGDGGGYVPSPEVVNFASAREWNPQTAGEKLAPIIAASWFAQELMPKLSFRVLEENEAIADLANAAAVGTEFRSQLRLLLDYMETAGLVQRDGTLIRRRAPVPQNGESKQLPEPATEQRETPPPKTSAVSTSFVQPTQGVVQFQVNVRVDMNEFAGWQADRIAAFFSGIGQVLAAKGALETTASRE